MRKSFLLVLSVSLILVSCVITQVTNSVTATPFVTAPTSVSASPIPAQTSIAKLTPKHNDLIFIEFFAVT
jgi:hypothetical protein